MVDIADIKEKVNLKDYISTILVPQRGGKFLCPFHDDSRPSLSVKGKVWRCFACGVGGDIIEFTKKYYGISTPEAVKAVADKYGIDGKPKCRVRLDKIGARNNLWKKYERDVIWGLQALYRLLPPEKKYTKETYEHRRCLDEAYKAVEDAIEWRIKRYEAFRNKV